MSDESRSVDDEVLTLIIFHEPLLRHIIGLSVDDPVDKEDVYQETVVVILEYLRKGKSVEHPKAWMAGIAKDKCADLNFEKLRVFLKKIHITYIGSEDGTKNR